MFPLESLVAASRPPRLLSDIAQPQRSNCRRGHAAQPA